MPKNYLLDTNVLVHWVNKADGSDRIEAQLLTTQRTRLHVSVLTVWEISRMVEKARVSSRASRALAETLSLVQPIGLDETTAALGGSLHGYLSNKGLTIGERDSMIAATALSKNFVMVTDNVKEFLRVPKIQIENWRNPDSIPLL